MNLTSKTIAGLLKARFATITVANGYLTNIGLRGFAGKLLLDEGQAPCFVIREGDDAVQEQMRAKVRTMQRYAVEGHDACDPDDPNDKAHDILRDVMFCLFNEAADNSFGGHVRKVFYRGRAIGTREDGLAFVSASMEFDLEFVIALTDP